MGDGAAPVRSTAPLVREAAPAQTGAFQQNAGVCGSFIASQCNLQNAGMNSSQPDDILVLPNINFRIDDNEPIRPTHSHAPPSERSNNPMRLSQTLMLSTAVASFLLAHQPASAQLSALGTCRRLLDTNPATPERSSETCFLDALSGVNRNGKIVSYEAVAHAQLLETADSDLGVYDVILSISASGFVPVGRPFGEVVVSGSDGNPCVLETDVADFRETICSQIFSFDGVFTADMRIENFVDPD
jgi:hypothetical protein